MTGCGVGGGALPLHADGEVEGTRVKPLCSQLLGHVLALQFDIQASHAELGVFVGDFEGVFVHAAFVLGHLVGEVVGSTVESAVGDQSPDDEPVPEA